ncbi:MAG: putative zinc-binding protein [Caldimonas sp.]|uniref:putative zinc-binding protein n=1 Tax=Caldimonas sp. TaxID=2838790 RepID=UPI003919C5F8
MPHPSAPLTLAYSCSGCSSAAQMANHLALRLDREGLAEMSCIAGVGGDVPSLLRKLHEAVGGGRPVLAIDGCALACVKHSLARHGIVPTAHVQLGEQGVRKAYHADFDPAQADTAYAGLRERVQAMNALATPSASECNGHGRCRCTGA